MAGFTRKALQAIGLTDEQLEKVMALHGTTLSDYGLKSEFEAEKEKAVAEAIANVKPNVKETDEYKALEKDYENYKTRQKARYSDEYSTIKPKFFDSVYDRIDRSEQAKPLAEQLEEIKKDYEEYFISAEQKNTPIFSKQNGQTPPPVEKEDQLVKQIADNW